MVRLGPERRHQGGSGVHVPSSVFCIPMHEAPAHRCKRVGSAGRRLPASLLPQQHLALMTHHPHTGTFSVSLMKELPVNILPPGGVVGWCSFSLTDTTCLLKRPWCEILL